MDSKIIFYLFIFMVMAPTLTFAHGDGHGGKNNPASQAAKIHAPNDSIYVVDSEKDTESSIIGDDPLSFSLSNTDILSSKNSTGLGTGDGEPMIRFKEQVNPQGEHSQHEKQKQHVEKATHEWVSSRAKGHGVAVGITIISVLAFAGLSFFRIGEENAKDPS